MVADVNRFSEIQEKAEGTEYEEKIKQMFPTPKSVYDDIIRVLKKYVDLREEYYHIIAIWIIGTYFHENFATYPYLFFNAVKGSGKTRILKLIASLAYNGCVVVNVSEAVLFRTAKGRTLCIDEFESVGNKEKQALRELLCVAYKRGGVVERAYKVKGEKREKIEIEKFDVYCCIAMANVKGVENAISDRCIVLILEKSINKKITRLIENFDEDEEIKAIKNNLLYFKKLLENYDINYNKMQQDEADVSVCVHDYVRSAGWGEYIKRDIYRHWNNYISTNIHTHTYTSTQNTKHTQTYNNLINLFKKIYDSDLQGRDLELFFSLFLIAAGISEDVLDKIITIAKDIVKAKSEEEVAESRDIALLRFIVSNLEETDDFIAIKEITTLFKEKEEEEWVTAEWVGRALKRLGILIEKRRMARGKEVRINFKLARAKLQMYDEMLPIVTPELERIIKEKKIEELKTELPELVKTCPLCDLEVDVLDWNEAEQCCRFCAKTK